MSDVENSPDKTGDRRTVETGQVRERRDIPSDDSSAFAAFDLFKVYLDKKLGNFKRDLTDESEVKSDQIVKKLKAETSYKFKYVGNQKQFGFNEEIKSEISKIHRAVDRKDLKSARDICEDIDEKIRKRNKLQMHQDGR